MSGTLIKAEWILTAAHGNCGIVLGQQIDINGKAYAIEASMNHPDFNHQLNDIALIKLSSPVEGITPTPIYRQQDEVNKQIYIAGYGYYGTGQTGPDSSDHKLRVGTNVVDKIWNGCLEFDFDKPGNKDISELESISGPGDSGGPLYIEKDGQLYIAGVSAFQRNKGQEGIYGVKEYYTRVFRLFRLD